MKNKSKQIISPKVRTADAIARAGNRNKLATLLNMHRNTLRDWGEFMPLGRAFQVVQVWPDLNLNGIDESESIKEPPP